MHLFIGGPPTSGKSYLAEKISQEMGTLHICTDKLRKKITFNDESFFVWKEFFISKPSEYWDLVTGEEYVKDCRLQTEAFWPKLVEEIKQLQLEHVAVIFEGVDMLPDLVRRDLDLEGIYLVCKSEGESYLRNKERWGESDKLLQRESVLYATDEAMEIRRLAGEFGYKVFSNSQEAEAELLSLLGRGL